MEFIIIWLILLFLSVSATGNGDIANDMAPEPFVISANKMIFILENKPGWLP